MVSLEMNTVTHVQILNQVVSISRNIIIFGEVINPSILPQVREL